MKMRDGRTRVGFGAKKLALRDCASKRPRDWSSDGWVLYTYRKEIVKRKKKKLLPSRSLVLFSFFLLWSVCYTFSLTVRLRIFYVIVIIIYFLDISLFLIISPLLSTIPRFLSLLLLPSANRMSLLTIQIFLSRLFPILSSCFFLFVSFLRQTSQALLPRLRITRSLFSSSLRSCLFLFLV